jgi:hypothetical protein
MDFKAIYPDGRAEVLLNAPNYSFSCQTVYYAAKPIPIPKGTKIVVTAYSAPNVWADMWPVVGPQAEVVMRECRATCNESILLVMDRHGYTEEAYFTFSYSPAPDDAGGVGGVICAVTEDTARVLDERPRSALVDNRPGQRRLSALSRVSISSQQSVPAIR